MLFKLFNNDFYGKTIKNKWKHIEVKVVSQWKGRYGSLNRSTKLQSYDIFDENCTAIQIFKSKVYMKKIIK